MSGRVLEHYQQLAALLAPVGLQITTLTLTPRHSWRIELDNRLVLTLGREAPEPKLERFVRMIPVVAASQSRRMRRIDLRYTNGFAVEWEGPAVVLPGTAITTGSIEG
jgi:cell division protein FtsQ